MWLLFISLLLVFEAIADVLAKQYELTGSWIRFIIAIVGYVVANIFWLVALRYGAGLTKGAILFSLGSAILAIIIGLIFYQEQLTTTQLLGVILGLIAVCLIVWEP